MIWHYEHPTHVELTNSEQLLLNMPTAFPSTEALSEALFKPQKLEDREQRIARLAIDVATHEMAAKYPGVFDAQNIIEVVYDMAPLERPGVILGDRLSAAKFVYTVGEAELLDLPQQVAEDGQPCGGMIALEHVLPEGEHSFWRKHEELRQSYDDANGSWQSGFSAAAGALAGSDGRAYFNADVVPRLQCLSGAIDRINEWRSTHDL